MLSVEPALKLKEESYCCYLHNDVYHTQSNNPCQEQERFDQTCQPLWLHLQTSWYSAGKLENMLLQLNFCLITKQPANFVKIAQPSHMKNISSLSISDCKGSAIFNIRYFPFSLHSSLSTMQILLVVVLDWSRDGCCGHLTPYNSSRTKGRDSKGRPGAGEKPFVRKCSNT